MNEDEARTWIEARFGSDATSALDRFAASVLGENERQNLISPSTTSAIWTRHILDSAQLVPLAPANGVWVDVGTGAGFPGVVAAILRPQPTILVEPRRQRAAFLQHCVELLGLSHARVEAAKIEQIALPGAIISARAVGSVEKLLQAGAGCATTQTRWLLPRGGFDEADMAALRRKWGGLFHMKQSLTDPLSTILIIDGPFVR